MWHLSPPAQLWPCGLGAVLAPGQAESGLVESKAAPWLSSWEQSPVQLVTGHTFTQRQCFKDLIFTSFSPCQHSQLPSAQRSQSHACCRAAFLPPDLSHISRSPSCHFTFMFLTTETSGRSKPGLHQHHLWLTRRSEPCSLGQPCSQVWLPLSTSASNHRS